MNPTLAFIQTVLGLVPMALQYASAMRGTLSTTDQSTLDAMIAQHRQLALGSVAQADSDLDKAAQS